MFFLSLKQDKQMLYLLGLMYHEARRGVPEKIPKLKTVAEVLPKDKYKAWKITEEFINQFPSPVSAQNALDRFEEKFGCSLRELIESFGAATSSWQNNCGGKKWAIIGEKVDELFHKNWEAENEVERAIAELLELKHNSGSVCEKFEKLHRK